MTNEELIEIFHERAAIREFDGGYDRARAEYLAAKDVRDEFGFIPREVLEIVRRAK